MHAVLPAMLRAPQQSCLTSVALVSHMLRCYMLSVTLIIHVATYLPVTGYNSLLTVFLCWHRMCQSLASVLPVHVLTFACYVCGILPLFSDGSESERRCMHAPVNYVALYFAGRCV